jgi:hypothetical protein
MKLDYTKQKKESVSIVLFGASVLFAVLILIKVAGLFVASARTERLAKGAIAQGKSDPEEVEKHLAKFKAIVDELKKKDQKHPAGACVAYNVRLAGLL